MPTSTKSNASPEEPRSEPPLRCPERTCPTAASSLEELTKGPSSFRAWFPGCPGNECCHKYRGKPFFDVLPSYKIVLASESSPKDGFRRVKQAGWEPGHKDAIKYIDEDKKKLFFGQSHCPKCALSHFIGSVVERHGAETDACLSSDAPAEGLHSDSVRHQILENVRWFAQTEESKYRGLYQSIGDSIWECLDKNELYQRLRKQTFGDWTRLEPHILGQEQVAATHRYVRFEPREALEQEPRWRDKLRERLFHRS